MAAIIDLIMAASLILLSCHRREEEEEEEEEEGEKIYAHAYTTVATISLHAQRHRKRPKQTSI